MTPPVAPTAVRGEATTRGHGSTLQELLRRPAAPAFIGSAVVWIATWLIAGQGLFGTLTSGIEITSFLALVGIGQLFVITSGGGGIDLSIPYVITFSAYLSCKAMDGQDDRLILGVAVAVATGLLASAVSATLIEGLGMPPLVGTLAVGFILQTLILVQASTITGPPSPALVEFVSLRWGSIPVFGMFVILVVGVFTFIMRRTLFGRSVEAVGQSANAARLSGIRPRRVRAAVFLISGVLASLTGLFLAAWTGGPSPEMGNAYLLASIAAVVLGGSLIGGGRSSVPGAWAAALLLTLLTTLAAVADMGGGMLFIFQGVLIVLVLSLSSSPNNA